MHSCSCTQTRMDTQKPTEQDCDSDWACKLASVSDSSEIVLWALHFFFLLLYGTCMGMSHEIEQLKTCCYAYILCMSWLLSVNTPYFKAFSPPVIFLFFNFWKKCQWHHQRVVDIEYLSCCYDCLSCPCRCLYMSHQTAFAWHFALLSVSIKKQSFAPFAFLDTVSNTGGQCKSM